MHVAAFNSLIEVILFAIIVQNYMYIDLPAQSISVYMKTHTASFPIQPFAETAAPLVNEPRYCMKVCYCDIMGPILTI